MVNWSIIANERKKSGPDSIVVSLFGNMIGRNEKEEEKPRSKYHSDAVDTGCLVQSLGFLIFEKLRT